MARIRIQRRGLVPAVGVTVLGILAAYLLSTWGWSAWQSARTNPVAGVGTLPDVVEQPPPSVATTAEYGPIGSVSMVFAGTDVRDGLFGEVDPVWLAVSALRGDYRALSVPGLPEPARGAVAVSPAGDQLAWVGEAGVTLYDPVTDATRTVRVPGVSAVGAFSPDGSRLLVQAEDGLSVLELGPGEVVSTFEAGPESLRRTAWRPDSRTIDFVRGDELVTGEVPGSATTTQPTDIPEAAPLAWSPSGDQLVSLRESSGAKRLFVSQVGDRGQLGEGRVVPVPLVSMDRLIGFSDHNSVAVVAYALESGSVERVLDVPLEGGSATDVTTFPSPGENWAGTGTVAIATENLAFGSTDFEEHIWPWSYTSRLAFCTLVGLFFLGLFVTRRPRRR